MHALRLVDTSRVFNRRRAKRCVLDRRTSAVLIVGGERHPCTIEDISLGGMGLCFPAEAPATAEDAVVEHAVAGRFPGRCVWTKGTAAGFRFDRPDNALERELQCIAIMLADDGTQAVRQPVP
ncbi:MAG: PilZ domain-containing protein [Inquilinus sp.]|nr:PilZ domain-containing protein [Inquilinus sp.]